MGRERRMRRTEVKTEEKWSHWRETEQLSDTVNLGERKERGIKVFLLDLFAPD